MKGFSVTILLLSASIFLFVHTINGQSKDDLLRKIKSELVKMNEEDPYKQGLVGFSLRSPKGEEVVRFNSNKALVPASNMKVLTTATALKVLGENFRYETKFYYTGTIVSGVLDGDIIIEGSGDPTLGSTRINGNLSSADFISLVVSKIKAAGINKINGTIVQDVSVFDKNVIPDGWIWTDIGNYYGAGAFGINFNENLYNIYFRSGKKVGDSTSVLRCEPEVPGLRIENKVTSAAVGSGDNAWVYGAPYSNYRIISGTIPACANEFSIKASLPDPPYLLVNTVYNELLKNNIPVKTKPVSTDQIQPIGSSLKNIKNLFHTHYSPFLKDIVYYTNLNSLNLYAESIYRTLQKRFPSFMKELISEYWKSQGIITEGNFIYDGSGLSPQTGIKPGFITLILFESTKDTSFTSFYNSLPVAGESGTLTRFCKGTKAEKKIHAKSGSMEKVLGYSGFVKGKSGEQYSFCILVNNYAGSYSKCMQRIEKIMELLVDL